MKFFDISTQAQIRNIIESEIPGKRGRGRAKKPYLGGIKHRMQISKYCDNMGAVLDRREWFRLHGITVTV